MFDFLGLCLKTWEPSKDVNFVWFDSCIRNLIEATIEQTKKYILYDRKDQDNKLPGSSKENSRF